MFWLTVLIFYKKTTSYRYHPGLFQRGYRGKLFFNLSLMVKRISLQPLLYGTVQIMPKKLVFFPAYLAFWKGVMQKVNCHPDGLLQHRHIRNQIQTSAAVSKVAKKSPTAASLGLIFFIFIPKAPRHMILLFSSMKKLKILLWHFFPKKRSLEDLDFGSLQYSRLGFNPKKLIFDQMKALLLVPKPLLFILTVTEDFIN